VPNDIFSAKAFDVWLIKSLSNIDMLTDAEVNYFDTPSKVNAMTLFGETQVVLAFNLTNIL
jgi:hypothetical protein